MRYLTTERVHEIAKLADAKVAAQDRARGENGDIRSPEASAAFAERVRSRPGQEEQAFHQAISSFSDDELAELYALMLLGRDWEGNFEQAFDHARHLGSRSDRETAVTGKDLALSRYVRRGLERLSNSEEA